MGSWDEASALLSEAVATARKVGDRGAAAEAAVALVYVELHTDAGASHAKARAELQRAIGVFEELDDKAGLSRAVGTAAMIHSWAGESARALEEMERAARVAEESGDRMQEQRSLSGIVMALTYGPVPVVEVLEKILEDEAKYEVEVAKSGFSAGITAEKFRPHVILLDMHLGGIDAREVCKQVKSSPDLQLTKVISMSSKLTDDELRAWRTLMQKTHEP